MSHAPQAAIDERPVTAARSARGRADRPSAERYAPVVRIAVLCAVEFGARLARNVFGIELRGRNPRQLIYFDSVISAQRVQHSAVFFTTCGLAGEPKVLQMGVRLAVGHRSP